MANRIRLGPTTGTHSPDYKLTFYRNGNPARKIPRRRFDNRSVIAIQTSKNINDLAGTFSITVKDKKARSALREMDTVVIRLRGHGSASYVTVFKGVLDGVRPVGSADTFGGSEDSVIHGRCMAKYLQVASLFLPVWDPDGNLPTALTFGLGDVTRKGSATFKAGGLTPFNIFAYLTRTYVYGGKNIVGTGGVANARHWLDHKTRFSRKVGFEVPFLQFDENSMGDALKRLEIVGFTEAWIDELGRVVYRRPQWDAPVRYLLHTDELRDWDMPRDDVDVATYVEVIPAGDPGIDSAIAQALRAGRAPVPSSYVRTGKRKTQLGKYVSDEYIIDTDSAGRVTAKGRRNHWWRLQRRFGIRPQQLSSPLLVTQEQAQAHAEALLRFYSRTSKGMSLTIPGDPRVRLGHTLRCHGRLENVGFDRSGYLEQVSHQYVESPDGGEYTTQLGCTHGREARDPFTGHPDPKWGRMVLPKFDPDQLADGGGVLDGDLSPGGGIRDRIVFEAQRTLTERSGFSRYSLSGALTGDPTPRAPYRSDCSQWLRAIYLKAGAGDPGTNTTGMASKGTRTSRPRPGDIMLTADTGHCELYIGGGDTIGHGTAPIDHANVDAFPGHYFVTFDFLSE